MDIQKSFELLDTQQSNYNLTEEELQELRDMRAERVPLNMDRFLYLFDKWFSGSFENGD